MIISDPRFACAYYSGNIHDWRKFDDIGCMFVLLRRDRYERETAYVHDFETTSWIEGEEATFVISGAIKTPMSTGIVAFSLATDAESFVKKNGGETYSFSGLAQE